MALHFKGFLILILEEKELKELCLKKNTFYCTFFFYFEHSKADLCIRKKKMLKKKQKKKKKQQFPTYLPYFFQAVT